MSGYKLYVESVSLKKHLFSNQAGKSVDYGSAATAATGLTFENITFAACHFGASNLDWVTFKSCSFNGANFVSVVAVGSSKLKLNIISSYIFGACIAPYNYDGIKLNTNHFAFIGTRNQINENTMQREDVIISDDNNLLSARLIGGVNVNHKDMSFSNVDISGLNLASADLSQASFVGAKITTAKLLPH